MNEPVPPTTPVHGPEVPPFTESLLEIRAQRWGVIVGCSAGTSWQGGHDIEAALARAFPGVTFMVVPGASSVAFPLPDGPA